MSQQDDSGPITVYQPNDPGLLAVAQSLLEEADIEFFVAGQVVSGLYPGALSVPTACQRFALRLRTPTRRETY